MLDRRRFLKASLAAGSFAALTACSTRWPSNNAPPLTLVSAVDDEAGQHYIGAVDAAGQARLQIPVPERCHGGCAQPHGDHVVVFARRPGRLMHVLNTRRGELERTIEAGDGYHYYGHGVYSQDARYLYVTMNHYHTSAGLVRVYDAFDGYSAVADYDLAGIGVPPMMGQVPANEFSIIGDFDSGGANLLANSEQSGHMAAEDSIVDASDNAAAPKEQSQKFQKALASKQ